MTKKLTKKIIRVLENGVEPAELVRRANRWLLFSRLDRDALILIGQMAEMIEALDGALDYYKERADDFEGQCAVEVKRRDDAEFFYENALAIAGRLRESAGLYGGIDSTDSEG